MLLYVIWLAAIVEPYVPLYPDCDVIVGTIINIAETSVTGEDLAYVQAGIYYAGYSTFSHPVVIFVVSTS